MGWRGIVPIEYVPRQVGPGNSVRISPEDYVGWIGPTGHVICYPIRGGELYNLFVGHVSEQWQEESWTVPSSKAEMLAALAGWNDALLGMLDKIEEVYKWGIYDRDPLDQWTRGRVTLDGRCGAPDDADSWRRVPRSRSRTPTRWRAISRAARTIRNAR